MAAAGAHLPLWDRNNVEQEGLIHGSEWDKLLTKATVRLKENLQLEDVWAHLETLGVLKLTDVERIQVCIYTHDSSALSLILLIETGK